VPVKISDGQVANRSGYVSDGIHLAGDATCAASGGTGGEGAKHWLATLAKLRNHRAADVCIVACAGPSCLTEGS
jgi:putative transposase